MATVVQSNLYPPIVNTQANAVSLTADKQLAAADKISIPYLISSFNSKEDFKASDYQYGMQIKITETATYNSTIIYTTNNLLGSGEDSRKGSIEFKLEQIENLGIKVDKKYRIQVRLVGKEAPDYDAASQTSIDSWANENLGQFTEWSSVCLFAFVYQPSLSIKGLSNYAAQEDITNLRGTLSFAAEDESDFLTGYKVKLERLDGGDPQVLVDDKEYNIPNTDNTFSYFIRNDLPQGAEFRLTIKQITKQYYDGNYTKTFTIESSGNYTNSTIRGIQVNNDNGQIFVDIDLSAGEQVLVRRSSAEEGFNFWDDLGVVTSEDELLSYDYTPWASNLSVMGDIAVAPKTLSSFVDNSAKSGVLYRYCLQGVTISGENISRRKEQTNYEEGFVVFDNAFILNNKQILAVKFDADFSGYQRTQIESKTETIGSKYPFIRRNGNVNYRQISLSGLITYLADENELFCSKQELEDRSFYNAAGYNDYQNYYRINPYNDVIVERNFREKVLDFLQDGKAKLLKTSPEGNMIVKLMDVKLTPKTELGRMIYSFSCTAQEIADDTVINYRKYDILNRIGGEKL